MSEQCRSCRSTRFHLTCNVFLSCHSVASVSSFLSNFARVQGPPTNGFEHFGVRVHLKGEHWTRPLSDRVANAPAAMGSRWRFVLFNPLSVCGVPRLQHVADLPRHASESSRQQRVSHKKVAGRLLGAPLRRERRTLHELFCGMHNDLLTSNQETRPLQDRAGTCYCCGTWGDVETTQWTFRLDSAGGIPTAALGEWGATSRTGERHPRDTGILSKKNIAEAKQRSTPILGLDLNSGLGLKGASGQVEEPFVGEGPTEIGSTRDGKPAAEHGQYLDHNNVSRIWTYVLLTTRHIAHTGSLGGTGWNSSHCGRLQLIPAGLPRDHMPTLLTL